MTAMHTVPPPPKDRSKYDSHRYYFWIALGCVAVIALAYWAFTLSFIGGFVRGSDGQLYYAQVRSLVVDHDLNYDNEMWLTPQPEAFPQGPPRAPNGRVANRHTFGWALVTLLPYGVTHYIVKLAGGEADGYSKPYQIVFSLWQLALCVLGMAMAARAAARLTGRTAAAFAFVTAFLATNVLYYAAVMPIMTHASSCAVVGLLLYCGVRLFEDPRRWLFWILSAMLVFLLVLLRPTNLSLAGVLLPAAWLLWQGNPRTMSVPKGRSTAWGARWLIPRFALVVLAVPLAVGVQFLAWRASLGYWTMNPYAQHGETMNLLRPAFPQIFISFKSGAWYHHPFYMLGFLGIAWGVYKNFRPGRLFWSWLLVGYLIHVYVHASWFQWWFGNAFGHRLFVDSAPIMLVGGALLYYRVRNTWGRRAIVGVFTLLIAWNLLLTLAATMYYLEPTNARHPPAMLIDAQVQTLQHFMKKVGL